jgi:hypothetical protein
MTKGDMPKRYIRQAGQHRGPTSAGAALRQEQKLPATKGLARPLVPYRYVFLRTKTALRYADSALASLAQVIDVEVELLTLTRQSPTWEDGMVIRFPADERPAELAQKWRDALSTFDAWAIHDGHGSSAETLEGGPLASAFEAAHARGTVGVTQLYFAFRHRDTNRAFRVDRLRRTLQLKSSTAFHFRDGQVLFLDTHEPAATTHRRMEGKRLTLYWCAICDANHETLALTANPGKCWNLVSLSSLIAIEEGRPESRYISVGRRHRSRSLSQAS